MNEASMRRTGAWRPFSIQARRKGRGGGRTTLPKALWGEKFTSGGAQLSPE